MSAAIQISGLSKAYRLGAIGGRTLREDVARWWARWRGLPDPLLKIGEEHKQRLIRTSQSESRSQPRNSDIFWALRNVSFEVRQGEILGVIGRNGAGKSTLLKILSRVTGPTEGEIRVRGRIASLLEVGTGFHPELTGRENIFLNGAILGMTKAEVRGKFDEIVAFSECEEFIDTPVKRYSSGMYVRLAFAVAAHLEPEILIVDEVLAVGDAAFQKKCLGKMREVSTRQGRTVIFVSHNMASVSHLCSRAVLLRDGELACDGQTDWVIQEYFQALSSDKQASVHGHAQAHFTVNQQAPMRLLGARVRSPQGNILHSDRPYEGVMVVEIDYEVVRPDSEAYVVCCFTDAAGADAWWQYDAETPEFGHRQPGRFRATLEVPARFLRAGRYFFRPAIVRLGGNAVDYHGSAFGVLVDDHQSVLARKGIPWPSLVCAQVPWRTRPLEAA